MSAKGHEPFDPSQAWAVAEGFLAKHGVSPNGLPISPALVRFLMIGIWTGCRFALLDREFALAVAAAGNERPGLVFEELRLAFAEEFEQPLREVIAGVLRQRGFSRQNGVGDRPADDCEVLGPSPRGCGSAETLGKSSKQPSNVVTITVAHPTGRPRLEGLPVLIAAILIPNLSGVDDQG